MRGQTRGSPVLVSHFRPIPMTLLSWSTSREETLDNPTGPEVRSFVLKLDIQLVKNGSQAVIRSEMLLKTRKHLT